jgi:hypothetical protein
MEKLHEVTTVKKQIFANSIIQKQCTYFLSIYKFTWEAGWHKSTINCFITNIKTSKLIKHIRVYISLEIESDHYLLCAKVNFPSRWLNKKNVSVRQVEIFKMRLFDDSRRWKVKQRVKLHLNNINKKETDVEKNCKSSKTY